LQVGGTALAQQQQQQNSAGTSAGSDNSSGGSFTDKAKQGFEAVQQYFEKALGTPTGQKVRAFYTEGQKQVLDIHNEALRLKGLKQEKAGGASGGSTCNCNGTGDCTCRNGQCKCSSCGNAPGGSSSTGATATTGTTDEKQL